VSQIDPEIYRLDFSKCGTGTPTGTVGPLIIVDTVFILKQVRMNIYMSQIWN
jgi:hypothetical protein